ncbi:hypothetical protein V6N13_086951 [Hibiscus sabdariffa]
MDKITNDSRTKWEIKHKKLKISPPFSASKSLILKKNQRQAFVYSLAISIFLFCFDISSQDLMLEEVCR